MASPYVLGTGNLKNELRTNYIEEEKVVLTSRGPGDSDMGGIAVQPE